MRLWKFRRNETTKKYIGLYVEQGYKNTMLWGFCISGILTAGALYAFTVLWGSLMPGMVLPAIAAAAELLCCCGVIPLRKKMAGAFLLPVIPWIIFPAALGYGNIASGGLTWLNVLISDWNQIHETGLLLFQVDAYPEMVLAFSVCMALVISTLSWALVVGGRIFFCGLWVLFWIFLQLLTEQLHPLAVSFLLVGLVAFFFSGTALRITRRSLVWWALISVCLTMAAVFIPHETMPSVTEAKEDVKTWIHDVRYGRQILPQGDLRKTEQLHESTDEMLIVKNSQEKNLYLRAFAGGVYEDGCWKALPDSAFGEDNTGMLDWLKAEQLDPLTQSSTYYQLDGENDGVTSNQVQITVKGASRDRLYIPASLASYPVKMAKAKKDDGLISRKLRGESAYRLEEFSSVRPAELMVAGRWVAEPQTEEQSRYSEAEAVYRNFVYEQYTVPDPVLYETIQDVFWKDYQSESDGIYSALTQIRQVLRDRVQYTESPQNVPEGADPILYFLIRSRAGNSMLYASTAVEAFRVHGIPARYAEGYYVSADAQNQDGEVSVSGQDAHAWVEVYFDGMGWMPVDVTPGYYYDTVALQQMVGLPDTAHRTAAFENNGTEASAVTGEAGDLTASFEQAVRQAIDWLMAGRGVLAMLLVLLTLALILLELVRMFLEMRLRQMYEQAVDREKVRLLVGSMFCFLQMAGISARLGWNSTSADEKIADRFASVEKGEYSLCCSLIEKSIYGEMELEAFELRIISSFLEKLQNGLKASGWKAKLRMHYVVFQKAYRQVVRAGRVSVA